MGEKILVIDDEPLVLTTIQKSLVKVGYNVVSVSGMKSFTEALSTGRFELLIMDLHMKGIDTNDLIKAVKESNPKIKILVMSGTISEEPSKYFLPKPFRIDELRQRVREILDESE